MAFREVLFPAEVSYGSAGGGKFKTTVFTADSGYEQRNVDWSNLRAEYDVSHGIKTRDQMDALVNFFYGVARGRAYSFRFKDWNDFEISNQNIGTGDGVALTFQLRKTYSFTQAESSETYTYARTLRKIVWGTVAGMNVNGVVKTSPTDYSVNYNTGLVTFVVAPEEGEAVVVGHAEFHVPVRFDTDHLDVSHEFWMTTSWPNIPLFEVRDWQEAL